MKLRKKPKLRKASLHKNQKGAQRSLRTLRYTMDKSRFLELCTPVAELVERKSADYQNGPVKHAEYFVFGHRSFVQMLRTKVLRLTSLAAAEASPNFESIDDSVQDLLAYTVFYLDFLNPPKQIPPTAITAPGLNKAWRDTSHE